MFNTGNDSLEPYVGRYWLLPAEELRAWIVMNERTAPAWVVKQITTLLQQETEVSAEFNQVQTKEKKERTPAQKWLKAYKKYREDGAFKNHVFSDDLERRIARAKKKDDPDDLHNLHKVCLLQNPTASAENLEAVTLVMLELRRACAVLPPTPSKPFLQDMRDQFFKRQCFTPMQATAIMRYARSAHWAEGFETALAKVTDRPLVQQPSIKGVGRAKDKGAKTPKDMGVISGRIFRPN